MIDINFFELFKGIIVTSFGVVWAFLKYFWWAILLVLAIELIPDIRDYLFDLVVGNKEDDEEREEKKNIKFAESVYKELLSRGLPVESEKFDGYKKIDIACVPAKLNIEVDGIQHSFNRQALSDLKRNYFSLEKGFVTIHIPNNLVKKSFKETVDWLEKMIRMRM